MKKKPITVASPLLPSLEAFIPYLEEIWKNKWISNGGSYHQALEEALCDYLKVPYLSLFTNGTTALLCALKALDISGEVITTPYSFVATAHALSWSGLTPVFADISPDDCNIDPARIREAISPKTRGILPVNIYGYPARTTEITDIAKEHNLQVIYDAAHVFGVEVNGESLLNAGDLSVLSLSATKVYNTIEGGAIVCHDKEMKKRIDSLRNYGFASETEVLFPGINGKMDEVRAAYGLLALKDAASAIEKRQVVFRQYRQALYSVRGVSFPEEKEGVKYTYAYFPILIDKDTFKMTRDELYVKMKEEGILCRRYFYPLITSFPPYNTYPSARAENLAVANRIADSVICLPMHHDLTEEDVERVLSYFA
ncbi:MULTISPECIES: DegT/DnrJ/EryC1/StrS family aminotransferase [unclassified Parabacteroides]|uniref:DegT/DnrJ/EryC1/StrS family aminotransferase n=1 Tax=unclassified Parabacteroides TaxID=2649774 RepID=UPI002474338D|nr:MULTISPECIES: DegT/DnrJ/EryC1/StrS family aminotransferase [unclassified Parabacteroides]